MESLLSECLSRGEMGEERERGRDRKRSYGGSRGGRGEDEELVVESDVY